MKIVVGPTLRARNGGFTLLELLVAMFIAAILFAMGYGTISQAVKNREVLQDQQKRLADLQTTVRVMEQDFVQLAQRPIRDPVGGTYQPALMSGANSAGGSRCGFSSGNCGPDLLSKSAPSGFTSNGVPPLVALTRAGWTNPTGLQRPTLQRVAYYFEKGTLRRESWNVLDPTQTSVTVKRELITNLKSVSLRFMDIQTATVAVQGQSQTLSAGATWSPIWPPLNNANQDTRRYRPIAVEITLETEDWGKIVRVVEVAG